MGFFGWEVRGTPTRGNTQPPTSTAAWKAAAGSCLVALGDAAALLAAAATTARRRLVGMHAACIHAGMHAVLRMRRHACSITTHAC